MSLISHQEGAQLPHFPEGSWSPILWDLLCTPLRGNFQEFAVEFEALVGISRFSYEWSTNCESQPQWPCCTLCGDMVGQRAVGGKGCQKLVKFHG